LNRPLPVLNAIPLCVSGTALFAYCHADTIAISDAEQRERSRWQWRRSNSSNDKLEKQWHISGNPAKAAAYEDLLAVLQTILMHEPQVRAIEVSLPPELAVMLARTGLLVPQGSRFVALAELVWQHAAGWQPQATTAFPVQQVISDGRRHPLRAPKPEGLVYARYIPWLKRRLTLRTLRIEDDLPMFNRWMNDPVVEQFWNESGDLAKHRAYLDTIARDPHMTSLIASFDDQPFAYFEVYWAKENRIAPFYDCGDFDRGWHVLVGEEAFRGKQFAVAWLTTISHYLLLDDCRTQVVVGEPRADHDKQIRNLDKSGYAKLKEFDFPHKRAMLVMLTRERYFGQGLWQPQTDLGVVDNPFHLLPH
jgi:acetyl CoA:N6-hydroxylysine acetyl transferase